ncbi:uncharacterized protein LOC126846986 [Adelges cooleyi]|uniref:uncharacterized protein LOC126846986 n=1 Tax=Adelges cooleyi TaxID=133065 RepID=UPI00217F387D|nr:uncharacterized protein LOC126846986 [Adelges cooleyi]
MYLKIIILFCLMHFFLSVKSEDPIEVEVIYYIWKEIVHDYFNTDFDTINSLLPNFAREKVNDWRTKNTPEMSMNYDTVKKMCKDIFGWTDMDVQNIWVPTEYNGYVKLDNMDSELISNVAKKDIRDWIKTNITAISVNYETFNKMCKAIFGKSDIEIYNLWMKMERRGSFIGLDTIINEFVCDEAKKDIKYWAMDNNTTSSVNFARFEVMMKSIFSKADGAEIVKFISDPDTLDSSKVKVD